MADSLSPRTRALLDEIEQLKAERNAAVLAHYYVAPEVQRAADYVGDSFALAKLAVELPQTTLVICGVEFMGESMKLLNPNKTVILPEPGADCPMAHMVVRETVEQARERYGSDLAVACYVNSTAEIKSWSDVCVTSSNAVAIVRALPQRHVLFIPDEHLGAYVAEQVPEKHVILNQGCCPFHANIPADEVARLKAAHPGALVLAHPECVSDVLALADVIGSTAEIIAAAEQSDASEFVVVTMDGVRAELARRTEGTGKRFFFPEQARCPEMDKVTIDKLASALRQAPVPGEKDAPAAGDAASEAPAERVDAPDTVRGFVRGVSVDAPLVAPAKRTLERMLQMARR